MLLAVSGKSKKHCKGNYLFSFKYYKLVSINKYTATDGDLLNSALLIIEKNVHCKQLAQGRHLSHAMI